MSGYRHGVYVSEMPTAIAPPVRITVSMPVVFGVAPIHKQGADKAKPVNEPMLCYSYQEFVSYFNFDSDFESYTLCEFAKVYFGLYGVAPIVAVNVFDPAVHRTDVTDQAATFDADGLISLGRYGVEDMVVKSDDGQTTYVAGTDYELVPHSGVVSRIEDGAIQAGADVTLAYSYGDPSLVDSNDVIGGIVPETGQNTGLELINDVFPRYRLLPGNIVAPGFSADPAVAITMAAKAASINTHFKCMAVVDLPVSGADAVDVYSKATGYKNDHNLTDELMVVCWPKLQLGNETHWMSSHLCGLMAQVDATHEEVPYKSPSNEQLLVEGAADDVNGESIWLGPDQANYLNGEGIITAINFIGGWRSWGNRTACYPAVTDVKDSFIPIRRMFNWIGNTLILSAWQRVDFPITKRTVDTIVDSFNIWLNGLAAREMILGGRVEFQREENPSTDLMDGIMRFHVYVTPPSPAREIEFILEYDTSYLETLFG